MLQSEAKSLTCRVSSTKFISMQNYLEIITKRPVAQHFKEGVMVHILAYVIQIIVLATSTDALLSIDNPNQFSHITVGVSSSEKQIN